MLQTVKHPHNSRYGTVPLNCCLPLYYHIMFATQLHMQTLVTTVLIAFLEIHTIIMPTLHGKD